jgi:RNA polymerase sigma factor (sigma-70 family)
MLSCRHDAEDAFQATFLVLVRKAASISPREMVANWLHGVAYQTARKARATTARRQARERQLITVVEPSLPDPAPGRELRLALDDALSHLPSRYRIAIVLCDLEGKTRKEAARYLGVLENTLSGWLARGRAMLVKRLARQGLSTVGLFAAVPAANASFGDVPVALVDATITMASSTGAGVITPHSLLSPVILDLTQRTLQAMFLTRLKRVALALVVSGTICLGGAFLSRNMAK